MICIGLLPLSPWTGPLGAGDSPFPGRFLKRRAPLVVLVHGIASCPETQRERDPRRAASRRTVEGIQPAGMHRPCSRSTGQPMPRPCTARWTKPGTRPGRWRAGGCSRFDRLGSALGRPATASAKEPPAAPSTRRSVERLGVAGPIQPDGPSPASRAIQPDGRSPAQGRAGGVRPVLQVTAAGRGTDQAPGKGGFRPPGSGSPAPPCAACPGSPPMPASSSGAGRRTPSGCRHAPAHPGRCGPTAPR